LKFDMTDIELLVRIGRLHVLQGNRRLAARAFNLALAEEPLNPVALQGLGILYFEANKPDEARQKLELAVAGDSQLWKTWNVLGVLADRRGQYDLAAGCYEKALEIRPESVSVRINEGYSRYLAGDLNTAARLLFNVAEESDDPKAWKNLGLVYAELGRYEEALDVFRRVEDEASAYNSTGAIALENEDLVPARTYLTEAVRQSPVYFAEAQQNLAEVRRRLGNL
ncbi:MAG TPA: tetratricopeptide repeat protein, partial [Woeseiaceae bacterium]|nr:tetratricopeptide repeat protein [Woeseiaceae bacterium]